jgi:hypothetical protein
LGSGLWALGSGTRDLDVSVQCPYCGEPLDLWVDETGGHSQKYVEDCQVCCQPMQVFVTVEDEEDCSVSVSRLDE